MASTSAIRYESYINSSEVIGTVGVANTWYTDAIWGIADAHREIKELQSEITELKMLLKLSPEDLAAIRELKQLKELILELGFEKLLMEGAE